MKLTVEQVRDAIERHSAWVIGNNRCFHNGAYEAIADELNAMAGDQDANSRADALSRRARDMARNIQGNLGRCLYRRKDVAEMEEVSEMLMELANELNATIGGGECELIYGENDHGDDGWWCQSCGGWFAASFRHTGRNNIIEPSYCQHCGKAVKR